MTEKKEALEIISTAGDGKTVTDVKFFVGHDRNVTQDELINEAAKGVKMLNDGDLSEANNINGENFRQVPFSALA